MLNEKSPHNFTNLTTKIIWTSFLESKSVIDYITVVNSVIFNILEMYREANKYIECRNWHINNDWRDMTKTLTAVGIDYKSTKENGNYLKMSLVKCITIQSFKYDCQKQDTLISYFLGFYVYYLVSIKGFLFLTGRYISPYYSHSVRVQSFHMNWRRWFLWWFAECFFCKLIFHL